jgi:hypothetical protein
MFNVMRALAVHRGRRVSARRSHARQAANPREVS